MAHDVSFTKMSGAGNDFIVIGPDAEARLGDGLVEWIRGACRRRLSIGSDGVVVVKPLDDDRIQVDFYNPDGTPAFCGNGSRCAARFASVQGMAKSSMCLETAVGSVVAEVMATQVALTLPMPVDHGRLMLDLDPGALDGRFIVAGVPHFVIEVPDLGAFDLEALGPKVRRHEKFGDHGTNLNIVAHHERGVVEIRTWERGVEGETLACGSGAMAAAYCQWSGSGDRTIRVIPASGIPIEIEFQGGSGPPSSVVMRGDASIVFEGIVTIAQP